MMSDPCREMRPLLGVAALGGLSPGEEIALRAHLDGCAACRDELRDLTAVARALPLADPAHVIPQQEPPADLGDLVFERLTRARADAHTRRVRRYAIVAGALAAAAAIVVALVLVLPSSSAGGTKVVLAGRPGVTATATLRAQKAGTQVAFHVAGLEDGQYYWLWLTGADGDRIAAGTFRGTPGSADLTMTAAIPLRDTRRIWVTDAQNTVVLDRKLSGTT